MEEEEEERWEEEDTIARLDYWSPIAGDRSLRSALHKKCTQ
jgi:hypothetical protein